MSAESDNRADFFRELAILLKSDLPLPGSIRNLARSARGSRFRKTLNQVGDATASGQTLAEAMKEFPRDFSVYQIRFVEVGESTGSLPDVLHEIGRLARADHHMIERTRALATYPVAVMLIGSAIFSVYCAMWFLSLTRYLRICSVIRRCRHSLNSQSACLVR